MPLPPIGEMEVFVFHLSVRECVLLARYLTNQWTEFHQTLVADEAEAMDELIRF